MIGMTEVLDVEVGESFVQRAATRARLLGADVSAEVWDAAGLVPRPAGAVPAWDYRAAAAQTEADRDPVLVAAAKANPTDRTAGFRAYGACY